MDRTADRQDRLRHRLGRGLGRAMADKLASLGADVGDPRPGRTPAGQVRRGGGPRRGRARRSRGTAPGSSRCWATSAIPGRWPRCRARSPTELGTVDILVNCAGGDIGSQGGKPNPNNALDIALEDIQVETNNNLIGTMLVCQTFVRPMRDRGSGCVVNIASAAAHMGAHAGGRLLDAQGGGRALHPLPRGGDASARRAGERGQPRARRRPRASRRRATTDPAMMETDDSLIRYADPEEIADAVAFLAGPQAKFIHGQVLRVDGGLTLFPG